MTKVEWEDYWSKYRNIPVTEKQDLFYQVGKTIGGKPITEEVFKVILEEIIHHLHLNQNDFVLDLCCGNGLITFELAKHVNQVIGIDFSEHLIQSAREHQKAENITYLFGDIVSTLEKGLPILKTGSVKMTMNEALAYFDIASATLLLKRLDEFCKKMKVPFKMFITGIPDDQLKWNFYNTTERKERYLQNQHEGINDGIGKWWKQEELQAICEKLNLTCEFLAQDKRLSNYRVNALIHNT